MERWGDWAHRQKQEKRDCKWNFQNGWNQEKQVEVFVTWLVIITYGNGNFIFTYICLFIFIYIYLYSTLIHIFIINV